MLVVAKQHDSYILDTRAYIILHKPAHVVYYYLLNWSGTPSGRFDSNVKP